MPGIKPGETLSQYAIRVAYETGNFWNPDNPEGFNVSYNDLKNLKPTDDVVVRAMISMSKMDAARYVGHVLKKIDRPPSAEEVVQPAIEAMVTDGVSRCPVPDYAPPTGVSFQFEDPYVQEVALRMQKNATLPALGPGSWAGCHNIGKFHCVTAQLNPSGMHPRVVPLQKTIMKNMQDMYRGVGLLWRFIGMDGNDLLTGEQFSGKINTRITFVQNSSGWIGLGIVGQRESCDSEIWFKLLATYLGGSTDAQIINQQSSLWSHEGGHNAGLGHTSGGVMSPSIQNGLPIGVWPASDPSTPKLKFEYGGVPVPIIGQPVPPADPNPPSDLQKQIDALQIGHTVQQVTIDWLVRKVRNLP
jgi:hypothetical protein